MVGANRQAVTLWRVWRHFAEVFDEVWQDALSQVRLEYKKVPFPDRWEFPADVDSLLCATFWNRS